MRSQIFRLKYWRSLAVLKLRATIMTKIIRACNKYSLKTIKLHAFALKKYSSKARGLEEILLSLFHAVTLSLSAV